MVVVACLGHPHPVLSGRELEMGGRRGVMDEAIPADDAMNMAVTPGGGGGGGKKMKSDLPAKV